MIFYYIVSFFLGFLAFEVVKLSPEMPYPASGSPHSMATEKPGSSVLNYHHGKERPTF
jgi:hypothetical protein